MEDATFLSIYYLWTPPPLLEFLTMLPLCSDFPFPWNTLGPFHHWYLCVLKDLYGCLCSTTEKKHGWWFFAYKLLLFHQKQIRLQDSKTVEEKAAKIKEWVMLKLSEVNMKQFVWSWMMGECHWCVIVLWTNSVETCLWFSLRLRMQH